MLVIMSIDDKNQEDWLKCQFQSLFFGSFLHFPSYLCRIILWFGSPTSAGMCFFLSLRIMHSFHVCVGSAYYLLIRIIACSYDYSYNNLIKYFLRVCSEWNCNLKTIWLMCALNFGYMQNFSFFPFVAFCVGCCCRFFPICNMAKVWTVNELHGVRSRIALNTMSIREHFCTLRTTIHYVCMHRSEWILVIA